MFIFKIGYWIYDKLHYYLHFSLYDLADSFALNHHPIIRIPNHIALVFHPNVNMKPHHLIQLMKIISDWNVEYLTIYHGNLLYNG